MIREPVARAVSWYFHRMQKFNNTYPLPTNERNATLDECLVSNQCPATSGTLNIFLLHLFAGIEGANKSPEKSLKLAKQNIRKHFSNVGLTEMMPEFFQMLEYMHPDYFTGTVDLYNKPNTDNETRKNVGVGKYPLPEKAVDIIKYWLRHSIELYKFVAQRFHLHLAQARSHIRITNLSKMKVKQCLPTKIQEVPAISKYHVIQVFNKTINNTPMVIRHSFNRDEDYINQLFQHQKKSNGKPKQ